MCSSDLGNVHRDFPNRSGGQRLLRDERFLHEGPVRFENLDTVVHAIADIQHVVVRESDTMHRVSELLAGRRIRIIFPEIGIVRFLAIGAPVPLVLAGVRVVDDYAMVAVTVGNVQLIGFRIDVGLGTPFTLSGSLLPLLIRGLPICSRNFPACVNFRI